jgi:distribution and morphology protein 34
MAFNFNWSPLVADTVRARDMLTTALNKSPKPPIIVDDIIVTELNLGTAPPDLEILEIGDLADDRFRGIFKMTYDGDAFLTLKTRVQANPLNTYLSAKPAFASPQPLAAASGLTIPLQITLSNFRLSAFVIIVFSRQKGLTLVFRNDPLESLKVSSTFDSIPFVRDYLQNVIEERLRVLFMEDLPAILHRLSLRLWSPDYCDPSEIMSPKEDNDAAPVDPLASPPQDPIDWLHTQLGDEYIPIMSLESRSDILATFSQKNLQRLAALSDSQRTLSLSTPSIRDVVFRAWAVASDRSSGHHTPIIAGLSTRAHSQHPSASSTYSMSSGAGSEVVRPTLSTASSYTYSRSGARQRKPKRRVIDLRRSQPSTTPAEVNPATTTTPPAPEPIIAPPFAPPIPLDRIAEEAPKSPTKLHFGAKSAEPATAKPPPSTTAAAAPPPPAYTPPSPTKPAILLSEKPRRPLHLKTSHSSSSSSGSTSIPLLRSLSADGLAAFSSPPPESTTTTASPSSSGGILEQAWMRKMASEIARRVEEERSKAENASRGLQGHHHHHQQKRAEMLGEPDEEGLFDAPPAYVS